MIMTIMMTMTMIIVMIMVAVMDGRCGWPPLTFDCPSLCRAQERGWSAIINDRLLSRILLLGVFVVTSLSTLLTVAFVATHGGNDDTQLVVGVASAVVCAVVSMVVVTLVESAVATVFVCFAHDRAALERSHPGDYALLVEAWCIAHPDVAAGCGLSMPGGVGSMVGMTMLATTATGGV